MKNYSSERDLFSKHFHIRTQHKCNILHSFYRRLWATIFSRWLHFSKICNLMGHRFIVNLGKEQISLMLKFQEKQKYLHFAAGRTLENVSGFVLLCAFMPWFEVNGSLSVGSTSLHFWPASA